MIIVDSFIIIATRIIRFVKNCFIEVSTLSKSSAAVSDSQCISPNKGKIRAPSNCLMNMTICELLSTQSCLGLAFILKIQIVSPITVKASQRPDDETIQSQRIFKSTTIKKPKLCIESYEASKFTT